MVPSRDVIDRGLAVPPIADGNPLNFRHCTVPGCNRPFYARGLCKNDYVQWRKAGKPDQWPPPPPPPKVIPERWRTLWSFRT